ncbi:hypothetical protein KC345_g11288, partial [Hortaea werneckii]
LAPLVRMEIEGLEQDDELLHQPGDQGGQHKARTPDIEQQREDYRQPAGQLQPLQDQHQRMYKVSQQPGQQ